MRIKVVLALLCLLFCFSIPTAGGAERGRKTGEVAQTLRFGTLPVLQSLPVFVAAEKGYFREEGLNVEVVTFNSALDKDLALTSGQIVGYFGDLMTPMVLNANKVPLKMVATIFSTPKERRMFALVAPPKGAGSGIREIAGEGVATSSNTILEYLLVRLLGSQGIPADQIRIVEVKSIPIRLQMLLAGQVAGAVLPEPLVTLAETKGARVLIDDRGRELSATVIAFTEHFLGTSPNGAKAFLRALQKASSYINAHPKEVRPIMIRECRVPETLKDTFPIPAYPRLTLPDQAQVMDVYQWLQGKGIIRKQMTFREIVADGYLPRTP